MKNLLAIVTLASCFGVTLFSQVVGDCPPVRSEHEVWVKNLNGVVTDETGAVIPKVRMTLQARKDKIFADVEDFQTDAVGKFAARVDTAGEYRLVVTGPKGFCKLSIPVWISEKGWSGLKLALPVGTGDCEKRIRMEERKPKL